MQAVLVDAPRKRDAIMENRGAMQSPAAEKIRLRHRIAVDRNLIPRIKSPVAFSAPVRCQMKNPKQMPLYDSSAMGSPDLPASAKRACRHYVPC
jgi:hypothetical protein